MHPIERRFKIKNVALRYNQTKHKFSSNTYFASTNSSLKNTCGQLFATDFVLVMLLRRVHFMDTILVGT